MKRYIEIIESKTGAVVNRIDITDIHERQAERVEMGVNIQMNHDSYHTEQNEYETEMPLNPPQQPKN